MDRKEAIRQFKEIKPLRGIFALRFTATPNIWVGASPNLGATKNGLFMFLRQGSHRNPALQSEWNTHGEQALQFEILEQIDDDTLPMAVRDLLKEKLRHWAKELNAQTLLP